MKLLGGASLAPSPCTQAHMTRAFQSDLMDSRGSLDIDELLGNFEPESSLGGNAPFLDQALVGASLQLELENRGSASSEVSGVV